MNNKTTQNHSIVQYKQPKLHDINYQPKEALPRKEVSKLRDNLFTLANELDGALIEASDGLQRVFNSIDDTITAEDALEILEAHMEVLCGLTEDVRGVACDIDEGYQSSSSSQQATKPKAIQIPSTHFKSFTPITSKKTAFLFLHQTAVSLIDSANEALIENSDVLDLLYVAADKIRETQNFAETMEQALQQILFPLTIQIKNAKPYAINRQMALETIQKVRSLHLGNKGESCHA